MGEIGIWYCPLKLKIREIPSITGSVHRNIRYGKSSVHKETKALDIVYPKNAFQTDFLVRIAYTKKKAINSCLR